MRAFQFYEKSLKVKSEQEVEGEMDSTPNLTV